MIRGGNGLVDGPAVPENLDNVMKKVAEKGFAHKPQVRLHLGAKCVICISCSKIFIHFLL